jgi:Tol biopolymer transport system component
MGEVYRATDTNLKRSVAVKVLPTSVAGDAERLARFRSEAEVLAALNHPNIAAIYGLERAGSTTALVMELVDGPTLADRLDGGQGLSLDEATAIARQLVDALEGAHAQHIVHRDLKPANIKVRQDGTVKVLDFGLAGHRSLGRVHEPRAGAWTSTRLWQLATAALALAATGSAWYEWRASTSVVLSEQRTEIVTPSTPDPNSFAISPDGRRVLFVAAGTGGQRLWLRSLAEVTAQPLADTERAVYPFWAPDGQSVAFFADGKLKRLDLGATKAVVLADVVGMRGGAWAADGTILYAGGTVGPLLRVPATGGVPATVTRLVSGQSNHRFPVLLPDGRRFLFFAVGTPQTQGIYLGSLDAPAVTRLTDASAAGAYLPSGWVAWVRNGALVAQRLQDGPSALVGDRVVLTDQLTYEGITLVPPVSVSREGAMVYRAAGAASRELRWFDPTGKPLDRLGTPDNYMINPRLSPDGRRALVTRSIDGNSDIWLVEAVRTTRLTSAPSAEQFAIWSPDGQRFAYRSNGSGTYNLFVAPVAAPGSAQVLVESSRDKVPNDWSRDGAYLFFQENFGTQSNWNLLARGPAGATEAFTVVGTPADERSATPSPDGRWLAYYSNVAGRYEVYVRPLAPPTAGAPAPGNVPQWQVSSGGGTMAKWRADGRALFYQGPDGQIMAATVSSTRDGLQVGAPVEVFRPGVLGASGDVNLGRQWDLAPDGRFLANVVRDVSSSLVLVQHWQPPSGR